MKHCPASPARQIPNLPSIGVLPLILNNKSTQIYVCPCDTVARTSKRSYAILNALVTTSVFLTGTELPADNYKLLQRLPQILVPAVTLLVVEQQMNNNQTTGPGLESNGPESTTVNAQNVVDLSPVINQSPVLLAG